MTQCKAQEDPVFSWACPNIHSPSTPKPSVFPEVACNSAIGLVKRGALPQEKSCAQHFVPLPALNGS